MGNLYLGKPASLKECDLGHSLSPWLAPNPATSYHLQDVKKPERDSFPPLPSLTFRPGML